MLNQIFLALKTLENGVEGVILFKYLDIWEKKTWEYIMKTNKQHNVMLTRKRRL